MNETLPPRGAPVTLVELNNDNLRAYLKLAVAPAQENLVAPNAVSIAQAYFNPQAWFRGIAAGGEPVGFAMLDDWTTVTDREPAADYVPGTIWLWRFMIDARCQKHGFGREALKLLVAHARSRVPGGTFFTSYVPADNSPGPFYRSVGFEETGELSGAERIVKMTL